MCKIEFVPLKTIPNRYYIMYKSKPKGIIEFRIIENHFRVEYIKVYEECRRMGIGTKVINQIKKEYPDKIICGDSLPEAIEFWTSIGVKFEEKNDNEIITPFHLI